MDRAGWGSWLGSEGGNIMLAVFPGPSGWLRANAASCPVARLLLYHSNTQGGTSSNPIRRCHLPDAYYVPDTVASTWYRLILILHSQFNLYKSLSKYCYSHSAYKETEALSGPLPIHCSQNPIFLKDYITKPEEAAHTQNFNGIFLFSLPPSMTSNFRLALYIDRTKWPPTSQLPYYPCSCSQERLIFLVRPQI